MARSERPHGELTDAELESFEDALDGLEDRVTEFLAEGTDRTPEQLVEDINEYDMPDSLDDRPVDDQDS